jgi:hypothetical protein
MYTCSGDCGQFLHETEFYHYTLASTGKRIRDKRCKSCRKLLTQANHKRTAVALAKAKADQLERNRINIMNDPEYKPVVFNRK